MQIYNGEIVKSKLNENSRGGTELLAERLQQSIDQTLLKEFQIVFSRLTDPLDPTKIRIYYCHDLAADPQTNILANQGWKNFHLIVFVSHYQMNQYIAKYAIPHDRCLVLLNSIYPLDNNLQTRRERTGPIKIGYWSTPHRGLEILVPVFDLLSKKYDIELDVYSSFEIYGWKERDQPYQQLFDRCRQHGRINYHGAVPNEQLREALADIDIMGYPSIWEETSCLALMEAMSAGIVAVHSNLGALYETAANMTMMYQYKEDPEAHAVDFYRMMELAIQSVRTDEQLASLQWQKAYADSFYNWNTRAKQWTAVLQNLLSIPSRELPTLKQSVWSYDTIR